MMEFNNCPKTWFLSAGKHVEMCVCDNHTDAVLLLGIVNETLSFRKEFGNCSRVKWGVAGFVYVLTRSSCVIVLLKHVVVVETVLLTS